MRSSWSAPRPESSPHIHRDDETTDRILIGPSEKAEMWQHVEKYEAMIARATAQDLRRELRTANEKIDDLTARCSALTEQIVKLKGRTK